MIFYWIIYGLFVLIHLVFCFIKKEKARKISKAFLLPLLAISCILLKLNNYFIYFGLLFGWIGDILLIFTDNEKLFVSGLISFAIGHVFYLIASCYRLITINNIEINASFIIFFIILFIVLLISAKLFFVKHLGKLAYLGALYFYLLFSLCLLNFYGNYYLSALGFLIFIISDSIIALTKLNRHPPHEDFHIMFTYIIAQTLVILSFV